MTIITRAIKKSKLTHAEMDNNFIELDAKKKDYLPNEIIDDNFEDGTVSPELTLSSGWSLGTDGIAITSNGGWNNSILFNKYTTIDRTSTRILVEITAISSVFSIIRRPIITGDMGTVAEVNGTLNKLRFYASWNGSGIAPSSTVKEITIPFTLVAGRKYLVELRKEKAKNVFILTDEANTVNTVTLIYDNEVDALSGSGRQWGAPGIMFISGSIKLKRFTYSSLFSRTPKLMITGHSFVEGYALVTLSNVAGTYSNMLYDYMNADVAIAGRGGETVATINQRDDIYLFNPKYHLVDLGSNDTDLTTFTTGIQTYIAKILASGALPILMTITPRGDKQSFINSANSWIRSSGYNYIDSAKAVTTGNDGITQNATFFTVDSVHTNVAGNRKIFDQILIDAPYLFDGLNMKKPTVAINFLINTKTASYVIGLSDVGNIVKMNVDTVNNLTVPENGGFEIGNQIKVVSYGIGQTTIAPSSGVTVKSKDSRLKLRTQYSTALLTYEGSNRWILEGDLVL